MNLSLHVWRRHTLLGGPYQYFTQGGVGYARNYAADAGSTFPGAAVEFDFDGDELVLNVDNVVAGVRSYWSFIDDVPQTAAPIPITDGSGTGEAVYRLHVQLGSSALRRFRICMPAALFGCMPAALFGGILGKPIYTVGPAGMRRLKVAFVADSWGAGAGGVAEMALIPNVIQALTGWDVARFAQGSTGYVAGGTGSSEPYGGETSRLPRIQGWRPDLIIVFGSLNDDNQAGVGAAAAAAGNVLGFVDPIGGGQSVPSWSGSTTYAAGDLVKHNAGVVYVCMLAHTSTSTFNSGVRCPLSWITGTGKSAAPAGDGTADRFLIADGLHLTTEGHNAFGRRLLLSVVNVVHALTS